MATKIKEIESLDGLATSMLNSRGWHMLTCYKVRAGTDGSGAYNNAVHKVHSHDRHAGIRTVVRDGVTYYEIWDLWK